MRGHRHSVASHPLRRRALALACAFCCLGCPSISSPDRARLDHIAPGVVLSAEPEGVTLIGEGFKTRVRADLDAPESTTVGGYTLLLSGPVSLELEGIERISEQELHAALPPSMPLGTYEAQLEDGWGRRVEGVVTLEVVQKMCAADGDCDDGLACTSDVCAGGACRHDPSGAYCLIDGACVSAGAANGTCKWCDPSASFTAWTTKTGLSCDDGVSCTTGDTCDAEARCSGGAICSAPPGSCFEPVGACLADSRCEYAPKTPGTACSDEDECTSGESCGSSGSCGGGTWSCGAIAPRACLTVSATSGTTATSFTFDASCSTDLDGPVSGLTARFDFDGNGTFDTAFGPLTATKTFTTTGVFLPLVEVRDGNGGKDHARTLVVVSLSGVTVTTAADENTPGASPATPGETGFSLREAIAYVNTLNQARAITFAGPLTLTFSSELPALLPNSSSIIGMPGVVLDFSGVTPTGAGCLTLNGDAQELSHVTVKGCPVDASGKGARVSFSTFPGGAGAAAVFTAEGQFGPSNAVTGYTGAQALLVRASNVKIERNVFRNNVTAIALTSGFNGAKLRFNEFVDHTGDVIRIPSDTGATDVEFNTFVRAPNAVVAPSSSAIDVDPRDNIFRDVQCAMAGAGSAFRELVPNYVYPATAASCAEWRTAGNISADPLFVSLSGGDLRLRANSPAIDSAKDLGVDTNGPAAGNFTGAAPDFGAHETVY